MPLTLKQLSYFVALSEERHFGRAAARVHVSQPALSMQIRDMEITLGLTLMERGRDIRLTPAGREVAQQARRVLADVAEIEGMARRKSTAGRVHLGVIPTIAPYLLPKLLPRLTMDLAVREAATETILAEMEEGRLDAIVIASSVSAAGTVTRPLFSDHFLLATNDARLGRMGDVEGLRPATLDPDQLLLLEEGHCLADQALEVCGLERRRLRMDLGASSLSTLAGLVGQGVGYTFLPELAIASETAAHPELRLTRFASPEPAREVLLVGRASTGAEPWFAELAENLGAVGEEIIATARARI
ncbi:hydrogen peroxide-inducible genes activator [Falsirhodobacter sp. alg1]|uniref:hydrogen peroxide-inducible genes activator n=1 Tax=Falsirhodobacter sp. alg1 TaxID=1472418 RepID=UPI0005EF1D00|nr:hydrogen peroxide-inducible genes activator [Falsirhodobacter sp. alg1]